MNFEMAAEMAAADAGTEVACGRHRRRRRGAGQPLHRRPPRRRRDRAAGEDRRRGRRGGPRPGRGRRPGQAGSTTQGRSMGMALTSLHGPGRRQADVRPARGRDGDRRRHPRRAGPVAGVPLAPAPRDRRACSSSRSSATSTYAGGDGVIALRQRHGRHAADRALPDVRRGRGAPREGRASRSPGPWSATTSPRWTWPAARSRCSRPTTSWSACGTLRSTPPACAGARDVTEAVDVDRPGRLDACEFRDGSCTRHGAT